MVAKNLSQKFKVLPLCVLAGIFIFGVLTPLKKTDALIDYELLGVHPEAAAQSTARGKTLHVLEIQDDKIYAGYGDYNANTGPISINPFDLNSSAFDGSQLSAPTEEINVIRNINGKLYMPLIDQTGCLNCAAGFVKTDPLEVVRPVSAIHVYDVATLNGTDLWIAGSTDPGTGGGLARAWRSADGTSGWQVAQSGEGGDPIERYYWLAAINGKMYMQQSTSLDTSIKIFDGTSWTSSNVDTLLASSDGYSVDVFENKIVATNGEYLSVFNPETDSLSRVKWSTLGANLTNARAKKIYINDGYLYVLLDGGKVLRTPDLESWQQLGLSVDTASSIAVHDGVIYIGTTDSKIYRSTTPINDPPTITISAPSSGAELTGTTSLQVNIESLIDVESVEYYADNIYIGTATSAPFSIEWNTNNVSTGSYMITARLKDADGTLMSSSPVPVSVVRTIQDDDNSPTTPGSGSSTSMAQNKTLSSIAVSHTNPSAIIRREDVNSNTSRNLGKDPASESDASESTKNGENAKTTSTYNKKSPIFSSRVLVVIFVIGLGVTVFFVRF